MPRESHVERSARALRVLSALDGAMPEAHIELDYTTPFELLVAVVLSAQCTDKRVNLVTPALFARFPSVDDYARAAPDDLYPFIESCGLYRGKAKNLVALARELLLRHGGQLPRSRAALASLPGVGG